MATLLSELVRVLAGSTGATLRARADGPGLSRAELLAVATIVDHAAILVDADIPPTPVADAGWPAFHALATFDLDRVAAVQRLRAAK